MPVRRLPSHPNLDHLKHQAKDLLRGLAARQPEVAQLLREFHPRFRHAADAEIFAAPLKLSDAQLAVARAHGFPTWARLKRHIERPTLTDRLDLPHHERIEDATLGEIRTVTPWWAFSRHAAAPGGRSKAPCRRSVAGGAWRAARPEGRALAWHASGLGGA